MAIEPKPAFIVFDMNDAILSEKNVIYMSGMLKRESEFTIKFLQLDGEGLLEWKKYYLNF